MKRLSLPLLSSTAILVLSGCFAPVDTTDLDRPLLKPGEETKFALSLPTGDVKIRDAVAVAKVLRRYRDLTAAEKALVKLAVRRHFDGVVALELRKLEQANVAERQRISRMPVAADRQAADAALSARLRAEAIRLASRLEGLVAVPLKTATNQSVLAFARVVSDDVRVADAAYEIDAPMSKVGPDTKVVVAAQKADRALEDIRQGDTKASVIASTTIAIK